MNKQEKQHAEIKKKYPDAIVFIGDQVEYKTFGEDAEDLQNYFGLAPVIPYADIDKTINKLVKAGYRVGLATQL